MNDPVCCVHRSRDSQCFSTSRTTPPPKKKPIHVGSRPSSNTWFIGPTRVSQTALDRFIRFRGENPWNQHTDRQTHRHTTLRATTVAISHILCTACLRCGLKLRIITTIKSIHNFLSYTANRQTNKQTNNSENSTTPDRSGETNQLHLSAAANTHSYNCHKFLSRGE